MVQKIDFFNSRTCRIDLNMAPSAFTEFAAAVAGALGFIPLIMAAAAVAGAGSIPIFGNGALAAAIAMLAAALVVVIKTVSKALTLFSYEIQVYGCRLTRVRPEVQASSDDLEMRDKQNGRIVEKIVDFAFANTVGICQLVADWLMMRIKLSRTPISIVMLGHMRQEPGDMILFQHPKSRQYLKALIHSIDKTFTVGGTDIQTITLFVLGEDM
jgi:hypothetical protein